MNQQFLDAFYLSLNGWPGDAVANEMFAMYCMGGEL